MKNLINLSIILFLFFGTLNAENINECKTDIYFGNGVWNSQFSIDNCKEDMASDCSRRILNDLIDEEIVQGDPKLKAKYGQVKLQYNWGQGTMLDVLETYYQLKEAGQVQDYQFYAVIALLTKGNLTLTLGAIASKELMEAFTRDWEQGNVEEMWQKYYDESFKLSHKVLLISHSQGNLFANRVYEKINPTGYKDYFANMQIASPASEVKAQKGDYVTLSTDLTSFDPVINFIPGSMSPNASGESGHELVSAYLLQEDPLNKITTKIKQLLANLDTEPSQWELDQELNKGTKDYKITLKHRFDTSITSMQGVEVYPFKPYEKLYHVTDNTGGNGWVKASCGGEEVFDYWDGQKNDEAYKLKGTNELITLTKLKYDIVRFLFIGILKDGRGWSEREINRVSMVLIGSIDNNRTYTDDTAISGQSSSIDTIIEGSYYDDYSVYNGYTISKPYSIGSTRVLFETSDIEELKNLVDKGIPLFSTNFNFTQDMFNKLLK